MIRDGIRRAFRLALRGRLRWERDVDEEIAFHIDCRTEQLIASGLSPDEARGAALQRFGEFTRGRHLMLDAAEKRERRAGVSELLDDLRQDVRYTLRTFGRQRAWTATAIATLAIGVGATTSMFSIFSSLVLHAVPYPNASRIVVVEEQTAHVGGAGGRMSILPPIMRAWRAQSHGFAALEPIGAGSEFVAAAHGDPIQASSARVTSNFITLTGQSPLRGRMFSAGEQGSKAPVVVLSESFWRTRFGGADSVIGHLITVNDTARAIIGVVPAAMKVVTMTLQADIWLPLDSTDNRHGLSAIGLLRPNASTAQTAIELDSIASHSGVFPRGKLLATATVLPPADRLRFHDSLFMLGVAVGLVLLVACGNTLHLLVARGIARRREFGIRAALGAGRRRLMRQLVTESLGIALAAALAGLVLGYVSLRTVIALRPFTLMELDAARIDGTTIMVVLLVSATCALSFGLLSSWQLARHDARDRLRAAAATTTSRGADRLRALLVVAEITVSVALVVGASLLIRSMRNRQHTNLGFNPAGVWSVNVPLPPSRYDDAQERAFVGELANRLRRTPQIRSVAMSAVGVYGGSSLVGTIEIEGEPPPPRDATGMVDVNEVDGAYFQTMGMPILEGTAFTDSTEQSTQAIVTAAFARAHWPAGHAVGHRFRIGLGKRGDWRTVVGVVSDAMVNGPMLGTPAPLIYGPWTSSGSGAVMFRAERGVNPNSMVNAIAHAMDSRLPRVFAGSMEASVNGALEAPRFTAAILTGFTVVALALAAIGLYGTLAYAVTQRSREIGVRIALGATARDIGRVVVARGMMLVAFGVVFGIVAAHWATRFIQSQLFGVDPLDIGSFVVGAAAIVVAGGLACVVPTRRALAVDPMTAIRAE